LENDGNRLCLVPCMDRYSVYSTYTRSLLAYVWMLIKSPNEEVADPNLALEVMAELSDKNYSDDITRFEIKAAAYAALGNFKKAISYQEDAIDEAEDLSADTTELKVNMALYKKKKLWFKS